MGGKTRPEGVEPSPSRFGGCCATITPRTQVILRVVKTVQYTP